MRLLLDTHALAWWLRDDPRLSARARQSIADPVNTVMVSAVSAFEAATKHRLGKWPDVELLVTDFERIVIAENFSLLPISTQHAIAAGGFVAIHKDPFDRLLAAQCKLDGLSLVSADTAFRQFELDILW